MGSAESAGELGEGVHLVCIPDEGSTERSRISVLLGLHLLCLGESFLVFLFVRYSGSRSVLVLDKVLNAASFVGLGLPLRPFGQLPVKLPGEDAGLHSPEAEAMMRRPSRLYPR